jgi:hypothetical protein
MTDAGARPGTLRARATGGQPPVAVHVSGAGNVYMTEIAEQLVDACRSASRTAELRIDDLPAADGRIHLVVAPHEFFPLHPLQDPVRLAAAARVAHGVNTEQPGSPWFDIAATWCREAEMTFDINARGARALEERGIPAWHLPLGYTPGRDVWGGVHGERPLDLTYLGDDSPRRVAFLGRHADRLAELRAELRLFRSDRTVRPGRSGFLDRAGRLDLLSRSRVLLNIHRGDQPYFEWVRVLDAMANGCVVVSETSTDTGPLVPGRHFLEAPLEHLIDVASGLLDNEPLRRRMASEAHEVLRHDLSLSVLLETALERLPRPTEPIADHAPTGHRDPDPPSVITRAGTSEAVASEQGGAAVRAGADEERRDAPLQVTPTTHWSAASPAVSIVLLVRDQAHAVHGAVSAALRAADRLAAEVVVVDRGSTDRSRNLVETIVAGRPGAPLVLVGLRRSATAEVALTSALQVARGERVLVADGATELGAVAVEHLVARAPHGVVAVAITGVAGEPPSLADHVAEDLQRPDRPATETVPTFVADASSLSLPIDTDASSLLGSLIDHGVLVEHQPVLAGVYRPRPSTGTSTPK